MRLSSSILKRAQRWCGNASRALVWIGVCGSIAVACAPASKSEPQLTHAYRLIDAQRNDEAIALLEKLGKEDPENPEVQTALASAYAHRAGIRIQRLWALVKNVKDSGEFFKSLASDKEEHPTAAEKIDDTLMRTANLLHKFAKVAEIYASIPNVKPEDRPYLDQAVLIMNNAKKARDGDVVFRMLLKIIQFKSSLAENVVTDARDSTASSLDESCMVDLQRTTSAVADQAQQLVSILDDAAQVFPDQKGKLQEIRFKVADSASKLTSGVSSLIVFEMASSSILKASVIENNFGKLLKCGGAQH